MSYSAYITVTDSHIFLLINVLSYSGIAPAYLNSDFTLANVQRRAVSSWCTDAFLLVRIQTGTRQYGGRGFLLKNLRLCYLLGLLFHTYLYSREFTNAHSSAKTFGRLTCCKLRIRIWFVWRKRSPYVTVVLVCHKRVEHFFFHSHPSVCDQARVYCFGSSKYQN
jgi:hypothetical protein